MITDTKKGFYALITGGSMGIGKAIAEELASKGKNILLVALDTPELYASAAEIQTNFGVDVLALAKDITADNAPKEIYEWCVSNNVDIDILINNAGRGNSGLLEENTLEDYLGIIDLNNRAMVQLTYHFIKDLKKRSSAFIMNTSSMEATLPLPYKAVYTASKNFIYAFSMSLSEELKRTSNVKVSILCPGSVITNPHGDERINAQGAKSKIIILPVKEVAQIAVKGMLNNKRVIIPGLGPWAIVKLLWFFPTSLKMRVLEKVFRAYINTGTLNAGKQAEKIHVN